VAQLEENIRSLDVVLSKEVRAGIKAIHQAIPDPAP
jgi:aryl-alcohol dehydrogenase-like predicted oxidoreductase